MRPLLATTQRNRSRAILAVLSTGLAAATLAGTGFASAAVAVQTEAKNADKAAKKAEADRVAAKAYHQQLIAWAKANPVIVTKKRPVKRVVDPPTVVSASGAGAARVGGYSSGSTSSSSSGSSGGSSSASRPAPAPAPPPPAPSTGS